MPLKWLQPPDVLAYKLVNPLSARGRGRMGSKDKQTRGLACT